MGETCRRANHALMAAPAIAVALEVRSVYPVGRLGDYVEKALEVTTTESIRVRQPPWPRPLVPRRKRRTPRSMSQIAVAAKRSSRRGYRWTVPAPMAPILQQKQSLTGRMAGDSQSRRPRSGSVAAPATAAPPRPKRCSATTKAAFGSRKLRAATPRKGSPRVADSFTR
jgi:hypothetical protein